MKLIVIHKNANVSQDNDSNLLRSAICTEPLGTITLSCLNGAPKRNSSGFGIRCNPDSRSNNEIIAIPQGWAAQTANTKSNIVYYEQNLPIFLQTDSRSKLEEWFIISNGKFTTQIDYKWLYGILAKLKAPVITVNVIPQLQSGQEKVLFTSQSKLVGFRRLYNDFAQPAPIPDDWPQHLFIKTAIFNRLLVDSALPLSFSRFVDICFSKSLTVRSLNVGGSVLDLETEDGLLALLTTRLHSSPHNYPDANNESHSRIQNKQSITISNSTRLFGKVLFGRRVTVGQNTIIVGPTIIGDNVKIGADVVIRKAVVGSDISVPNNHIIQNRVLFHQQTHQKQAERIKINHTITCANLRTACTHSFPDNFRTWPRFAYATCLKRIADIVAAVIVLILFAPVLPLIALVVKLTSRGPVFFKDSRQGLHGKVFGCLKFRTMLVGADKIQDKLRVFNQADGPQFKMADDPRLSAVGKFLRDTYIDELPQFFNVLFGQMSLVGPRPSPESENALCPSWRDARLSVRPGITGLWQACRTRQPMKDFQEWIHYDIKYARDLSLMLDLWICWQTAKEVVNNFINQF
jgi:lipopolysaccharide/colanic/teichoic acid biosynthesis glycosyltransferase